MSDPFAPIEDVLRIGEVSFVIRVAARVYPEAFRDENWDLRPELLQHPLAGTLQHHAQHQQAHVMARATLTVIETLAQAKTAAAVAQQDLALATGVLRGATDRGFGRRQVRNAIRADWRRVLLRSLGLPASPWPFVPGVLAALDQQAGRIRVATFLEDLWAVSSPAVQHG